MKFPPLYEARFLRRLNRFVGEINIGGKTEKALIRNTGRLKELLKEDNLIFVREKETGKYRYEIILAGYREFLVCIDSHITPKLYVEAIERGLAYYGGLKFFKYEPSLGNSRFDLFIETKGGKYIIETKSVNLVKEGIGLFPDAPTERGRRHIEELMNVEGELIPEIVFIIQREDALCFAPHKEMDPEFSDLLKSFRDKGGSIRAFKCRVTLEGIEVTEEVPLCF